VLSWAASLLDETKYFSLRIIVVGLFYWFSDLWSTLKLMYVISNQRPCIYPLTERTFDFPSKVGPYFLTPEGWKAELSDLSAASIYMVDVKYGELYADWSPWALCHAVLHAHIYMYVYIQSVCMSNNMLLLFTQVDWVNLCDYFFTTPTAWGCFLMELFWAEVWNGLPYMIRSWIAVCG